MALLSLIVLFPAVGFRITVLVTPTDEVAGTLAVLSNGNAMRGAEKGTAQGQFLTAVSLSGNCGAAPAPLRLSMLFLRRGDSGDMAVGINARLPQGGRVLRGVACLPLTASCSTADFRIAILATLTKKAADPPAVRRAPGLINQPRPCCNSGFNLRYAVLIFSIQHG